jgi:hypothetical protein
MRDGVKPNIWRRNFIEALRVLGEAAARLPFGVPDPVLCGAAAVELYTGGLWSTPRLIARTHAARALTVELFAAGFQLRHDQDGSGACLWHPDFEIGMDLLEHQTGAGSVGATNAVRVAIDEPAETARPVSVKAIGVEDLIVDEAVGSLARRRPSNEALVRGRVLMELGCEGICGGFCIGYLERRLRWETAGEVVLDSHLISASVEYAAGARTITLGEMRHVISTWRTRRGFSFEDAVSRTTRQVGSTKPLGYRAGMLCRAGGSSGGSAEVIPFNVAMTALYHRD